MSNLKRQLTSSKDAAFEEVQMRNKFLTEKLEELERQMARKALTGQVTITTQLLSISSYLTSTGGKLLDYMVSSHCYCYFLKENNEII